MVDFKIDNGPWETVINGKAYGRNYEVLVNPEHYFLVVIYDEQDGKKIGALIEGYKALVARGAMEAFIQTLPRHCLGLTKNSGDKTAKVFFYSFPPVYLDFREDDFTRKLGKELQKSYDTVNLIVDLARASSLDLKEPASIAKTEYAHILGDPFIGRLLLSGQESLSLSKLTVGEEERVEQKIAWQIGLGKMREIIKEPTESIYRSLIIGEKKQSVFYCMYILVENFLMDGKPVIIFDSNKYFDELAVASKNEYELKDYLVEYEPSGFPIKKYYAQQTIRVSMRDVDTYLLLDLLGTFDTDFQKELSLFAFSARVDTPNELINKILESNELNEYRKLKAERLLNIIAKDFGDIFGESVNIPDLTKKWPGRLGRATIIDVSTLTSEQRVIFEQTLLRLIGKFVSEKTNDPFVLIIPQGEELIRANPEKISANLSRLENQKIGVVLGASKKPQGDVADTMSSIFSVVSEKDVAVAVKNKRNYRVILRPSLSGSPKA